MTIKCRLTPREGRVIDGVVGEQVIEGYGEDGVGRRHLQVRQEWHLLVWHSRRDHCPPAVRVLLHLYVDVYEFLPRLQLMWNKGI